VIAVVVVAAAVVAAMIETSKLSSFLIFQNERP
jgi:hypothetical protein